MHRGRVLEGGALGDPNAWLGRGALQEILQKEPVEKLAVLRALHAKFLTQPRPLRNPPHPHRGVTYELPYRGVRILPGSFRHGISTHALGAYLAG